MIQKISKKGLCNLYVAMIKLAQRDISLYKKQLAKKGVLSECSCELLGTKLESIEMAEDRELFKELCQRLGEPVLPSEIATSIEEAKTVAKKISLAKDYCLTPADNLSSVDSDPDFSNYYALYQKRLEQTGNVDFGDLIMKSYMVLRDNEQVRNHMHNLFKVIMVDEYQDSNVAQFKLLEQLVGEKTYVCVVGDDDQSIYKFRGAEVENILQFQDVFKGTSVIKLEQNYRSVPAVLSLANSVIKNNTKRLGKEMKNVRTGGKPGILTFLPSNKDEADYVCRLIKDSKQKGVPFSSWAVLYRTNAQSRLLESAFNNGNVKIPYTIVGSVAFYKREEVKDLLSYIAFFSNPKDEISFRRIINKPARGIGNKSQDEIVELYLEQLANRNSSYNLLDACLDFAKTKKGKIHLSLLDFLSKMMELIKFFGSEENFSFMTPLENIVDSSINGEKKESSTEVEISTENKKLSDFVEKLIVLSGLREYYQAQDELGQTQRVMNLEEVKNIASAYPLNSTGLTEFLDHVELDKTLEEKNEEDENPDRVTLITIHNTKGLEFDRVIITGMEDGVFPRNDKVDDELEEERRLFYVGITRARYEIYFTSCGSESDNTALKGIAFANKDR